MSRLVLRVLIAGICGAVALPARAADQPDAYRASNDVDVMVARGLKWLVQVQEADGHWSLTNPQHDVAATALGVLPLLHADEAHVSRYADNIDRALKYLLAKQGQDGGFGMGYYHGLASMALCAAYARTSDPSLVGPAQRAIDYIVAAQGPNGGWRYAAKQPGDTSVSIWMIQALRIGARAGLRVPPATWKGAAEFLDAMAAADGGYGYTGPPATHRMTASGCLGRLMLETPVADQHFQKSLRLLRDLPPLRDHHNVYYYYHATLVMNHLDESTRDAWNRAMWTVLLEKQETEGADAGSWPAVGDAFGSSSGRVMTTALSLLMLQQHYRQPPRSDPLPARPLSNKDLQTHWDRLSDSGPLAAAARGRALAAAAEQTLPFLRERLRATPAPEPKRVARLIADLDDQQFAVRRKAEAELEQLGELVVAALEQALRDKPPLEVQQRLTRLVQRQANTSLSPERLQQLRGVLVLELIATPDARRLLGTLAGGAPATQQTRAAEAALQRLRQRDR